jgi:hypothetical protein
VFRKPVVVGFTAMLLFLAAMWAADGEPPHHTFGFAGDSGQLGEHFLSENLLHNLRQGNVLRPFRTDLCNHPEGQDLGFAVANSLHLYFYAPLRVFLSPTQTYNAFVVIVTVLNLLAFYALARQRFESRLVCLSAAVVFAITPYLFLKLGIGHMQKYIVVWLALYFRSCIRLLDTRATKHAVWAAAFLVLMQLTYPPYALYTSLGTALVGLGALLRRADAIFVVTRLALIGLVAAAALLPLYLAMGFGPAYFGQLPEFEGRFVCLEGCVNLFRPFYFHPYIWAQHGTDRVLGVSFVATVVGLVGVFRTRGAPRWILLLFGLSLLLAAGPYLRGWDNAPMEAFGHRIPLPYAFLAGDLPLFGGIKFPIRLLPFAGLCLALLSGYGLQYLVSGISRRRRAMVCAAFVTFYLLENLLLFNMQIPPPVNEIRTPAVYAEIARRQSFEAVLNLPHSRHREVINSYGYYSFVAGKKIVNPYSVDTLPFPIPRDASPAVDKQAFVDEMVRWRVGAIVVHDRYTEGDYLLEAEPFDVAWLGQYAEIRRDPEDRVTTYWLPIRVQ